MKKTLYTLSFTLLSLLTFAQTEIKGTWDGKNRHGDKFQLDIAENFKWTTYAPNNPDGSSSTYSYEVLSNDTAGVLISMTPNNSTQEEVRTDYFFFTFTDADNGQVNLRANNDAKRQILIGTISRKK